MHFTVIVPYRDREHHLKIFAPAIKRYFREVAKTDMLLIVAEQADQNIGFRRGNLFNCGIVHSPDDSIIVTHDVDYVPDDEVVYYDDLWDVYLPLHRATFVYMNGREKPLDEVPGGYRIFRDHGPRDDFFGAMISMSKENWYRINGYSNRLKRWGVEEEITRKRIYHNGLSVKRAEKGRFTVLDHHDTGALVVNKPEYLENIREDREWQRYLHSGLSDLRADIKSVPPKYPDVDVWLECTNFDPPVKTHIVTSSWNFDEGSEE